MLESIIISSDDDLICDSQIIIQMVGAIPTPGML